MFNSCVILPLASIFHLLHSCNCFVTWRTQRLKLSASSKRHRLQGLFANGRKDGGFSDEKNNGQIPSYDEDRTREIGVNWIEKSSPSGIGNLSDAKTQTKGKAAPKGPDGFYDLGIDGISFSVGPLSKRMYDALESVALKRFPPGTESLPPDLEKIYRMYTMDITAKEAVKAALNQNGLDLAVDKDDESSQDSGLWGEIDSVQLVDYSFNPKGDIIASFDSLEDAIELGLWYPGQSFHFVARNVPARFKEMEISDLLKALDPDGTYRSEAKEKGIVMPDEDITTLKELGNDNERRADVSPRETESEDTVFRGDDSMGYNIMLRKDLLKESANMDGTENRATTLHVMDAFANHGCLIVDITDGGTNFNTAVKVANMWKMIDSFFERLDRDDSILKTLSPLSAAKDAGSRHATVGFASYEEGNMKFLETRIKRSSHGQNIDPEEIGEIIGKEGVQALTDAFKVMCDVGKDCTRIAIAAASVEAEAFIKQEIMKSDSRTLLDEGDDEEDDEDEPNLEISDERVEKEMRRLAKIDASDGASRLCDELIDDGLVLVSNENEGSVSMSPHRICSYSDKQSKTGMSETFGAHTDTSFVTIVPVAKVSGLEIFDEIANTWFRPELRARDAWKNEQKKRNQNDTLDFESVSVCENGEEKQLTLPWHCRYVVVLPGELLQLCTRNEVPASVHRVVTVTNGARRFSAPVLLRARPGMKMDVVKYFGSLEKAGPLLTECIDMRMEDIHDALQPSSFR